MRLFDSALTGSNPLAVGSLPAVNLPGPKEAGVVGVRTSLNF